MVTATPEMKEILAKAIKLYGDALWKIFLGIGIPEGFEDYENLSEQELKQKMQILKDFYNSL